jgi:hypothetical protein
MRWCDTGKGSHTSPLWFFVFSREANFFPAYKLSGTLPTELGNLSAMQTMDLKRFLQR